MALNCPLIDHPLACIMLTVRTHGYRPKSLACWCLFRELWLICAVRSTNDSGHILSQRRAKDYGSVEAGPPMMNGFDGDSSLGRLEGCLVFKKWTQTIVLKGGGGGMSCDGY